MGPWAVAAQHCTGSGTSASGSSLFSQMKLERHAYIAGEWSAQKKWGKTGRARGGVSLGPENEPGTSLSFSESGNAWAFQAPRRGLLATDPLWNVQTGPSTRRAARAAAGPSHTRDALFSALRPCPPKMLASLPVRPGFASTAAVAPVVSRRFSASAAAVLRRA